MIWLSKDQSLHIQMHDCTNRYWTKRFTFLDAKNILQEKWFIILISVKMIALSRLMSILHFYINFPMIGLSGKHTLCLLMNGMSSLGAGPLLVCTTPCWNWRKIVERKLDEKFMLNIFKPLKIKQLDNYIKYIFDLKKTPTITNTGNKYLERKSKRNCSTQPTKRIEQRLRLLSN